MTSEAQRAKINSELAELLQISENKKCAECGALGPRWASVSLGVFLCLRCAGIHRGLGPHISKVKSLTLDTWTENQVQFMKETGNAVSKSYFEAKLPRGTGRFTDDRQLVSFVNKKYEQKLYVNSDVSFEQFRLSSTANITKSSQPDEVIMQSNAKMNTSTSRSTHDTDLLDLISDNPYNSVSPKAPIKAPSNSQLLDIFSNPVSQPKNEITFDSIFSLTGNVQSDSGLERSAFSGIENVFYSQQKQQQQQQQQQWQQMQQQQLQHQPPNATSRVMTNEEILRLYNKPILTQPAQTGYNSSYFSAPIRPVGNNIPQMTLPNTPLYVKPITNNTQYQASEHVVDHNPLLSNANPSSKMSNAFSSNRNGFSGNQASYY